MKSIFKIEVVIIILIAILLLGLDYFKLMDIYITYSFVFLYGAYLLGRYIENKFYKRK